MDKIIEKRKDILDFVKLLPFLSNLGQNKTIFNGGIHSSVICNLFYLTILAYYEIIEEIVGNKFNKDDPTLFFLQNLRDEVHRYAIAGHRLKSKKALLKSPLDEIVGIGANRKKSLLEEFGSAKAVGSASLEDLLKVNGINKSIAENIFNFFN